MMLFTLCCFFVSVLANPFPEGSDAEARWVYHLADHDQNYKLTLLEFQRIFFDFDRNHDKAVTSDEFLVDWRERNLGSPFEAVVLFHHLDVDRNGQIEERDIPWILAFFDRNLDGYVGQAEFVITWLKLIHSTQSK
ncbi:insoluble matrix shell protein 5-like [Saccostrea cucullata]|uniref:insoluble matrix shell protein 5-like n=1 Tax=Saccostrea cuccullata TaxID=36930 RepID=UPI002ED2E2D8